MIGPEARVWREVAIALHAELADHGYDPNSPAVAAYNHARNHRYADALLALEVQP